MYNPQHTDTSHTHPHSTRVHTHGLYFYTQKSKDTAYTSVEIHILNPCKPLVKFFSYATYSQSRIQNKQQSSGYTNHGFRYIRCPVDTNGGVFLLHRLRTEQRSVPYRSNNAADADAGKFCPNFRFHTPLNLFCFLLSVRREISQESHEATAMGFWDVQVYKRTLECAEDFLWHRMRQYIFRNNILYHADACSYYDLFVMYTFIHPFILFKYCLKCIYSKCLFHEI